ncbi:MAG: ATP-binding protein [Clostridia bacterium]|nr:ATP-binding protein [Clostridia bacterium]
MNRQELLKIARRIIDERRFVAEEQCDNTLRTLRQNTEYKYCEKNLRLSQIKGDVAEIDKYKAQMQSLLKKLNLDEKALSPQYSCKTCNDSGFVNGEMCVCLKTELNRLLTAQSNVINSEYTFANSTETNKHNVAVFNTAKSVVEQGKQNILLTGNTGTGKTYLITACANLATSLNRSALFYTAYNLNSLFLEAHLSDYQTKQTILDTLTDADMLIIDDLGTEITYKNVTAEYLFAVINERIARKKQTLISTNLTLADLRDRYDERIFSRLVNQGSTLVAKLEGSDKRIKK